MTRVGDEAGVPMPPEPPPRRPVTETDRALYAVTAGRVGRTDPNGNRKQRRREAAEKRRRKQ